MTGLVATDHHRRQVIEPFAGRGQAALFAVGAGLAPALEAIS